MTELEYDLILANAEIETLKRKLKDRPEAIFCGDCKLLGIKDFAYGYCKEGHLSGILDATDGCTRGKGRERDG